MGAALESAPLPFREWFGWVVAVRGGVTRTARFFSESPEPLPHDRTAAFRQGRARTRRRREFFHGSNHTGDLLFRAMKLRASFKLVCTAVWLSGCVAVLADDWPQWLGPNRDAVWREDRILEEFPAGGPPIVWRRPIGPGYSGPSVAGGRVYVTDRRLASGESNPSSSFERGSAGGSERVLCLNENDGQQLWEHTYDCRYSISYTAGS